MSHLHLITPFLWFDRDAAAAAAHYVAIFPESRIISASGAVVDFDLAGVRLRAFNGGPTHAGFSEAISLSVRCDTQADVDHYWDRLVAGGTPSRCGWLKDKYGLSWQIVPSVLGQLLGSADRAASKRVMTALLTMSKPDIAHLLRAHEDAVGSS